MLSLWSLRKTNGGIVGGSGLRSRNPLPSGRGGIKTELKDNEVFVFGSNESGRHGKGAAKTAMKWGARYGQAEGLQGRTYAIPTVNKTISAHLSVGKINKYVDRFVDFAKENQQLHFFVTEIGCGLAGMSHKDIAPLFVRAMGLSNVSLPEKFIRIIEGII